MKTAYLSLGSNLGDCAANLQAALDALGAAGIEVRRVSSVYQTEPRDVKAQPWFLNAVAEIKTALPPRVLLARTQRIERQLGRKRGIPRGPRLIDIDILLYGSFVIHAPELIIPHPRMAERRFVLEPLAEIAPGLPDPVTRRTVDQMLALTLDQAVRKTGLILNL